MPGHGAWAGGKQGTYRIIMLRNMAFSLKGKLAVFFWRQDVKLKQQLRLIQHVAALRFIVRS